MSLAQEIYNELTKNKRASINRQFVEIVEDIKKNGGNNVEETRYYSIMYDEVRKMLEQEGFNVEVILFPNGSRGYSITLNKAFINEEEFNDSESSKGEII